MSDNIIYHWDMIKCPKCKSKQVAKVLHTEPWWSYVHECDCGYIITESEWDVVKKDVPLSTDKFATWAGKKIDG